MIHRPVRKKRDGYELLLTEPERQLLSDLLQQMGEMISGEARSDHPNLRRLFPVAHPNDPDLEASYRDLVGNELADLRRNKLSRVTASIHATRVSEDELADWMSVINDLRLVLGTHLDISEDDDPENFSQNHPDADAYAVYSYLSYLLDSIIQAIT